MSVTNLTGTTWSWNGGYADFSGATGEGVVKSIDFVSNNHSFTSMTFQRYHGGDCNDLTYNPNNIAVWSSDEDSGTVDFFTNYQVFAITGGTHVEDSTLIGWITANATQIIVPRLTVDISELPYYSSIPGGLHSLTITAQATGYRDGPPSQAYTINKLNTPTNLTASGTSVTFESVENAAEYEVFANGSSIGSYTLPASGITINWSAEGINCDAGIAYKAGSMSDFDTTEMRAEFDTASGTLQLNETTVTLYWWGKYSFRSPDVGTYQINSETAVDASAHNVNSPLILTLNNGDVLTVFSSYED